MANTLENTLAFSGADIQVVAYRNTGPNHRTPAERFEVDQTNLKIAQAERDLASLRKSVNQVAEDAEAAERAAIEAQQELNAVQAKRDALRSSGLSDVSAGRLSEVEGRFQNKQRDLIRGNQDLRALREQLLSSETNLEALKEKVSSYDEYPVFKLGTVHTLSYSSFREKFAVRTLGRVHAKTYTRGPRTIAGSLVFTVVQEHELMKLAASGEKINGLSHPDSVMLDQIQPFNLLLLFANEYGGYSALHLFNIDLQSEGQEMSIDQIITHNTMNFYATEMLPMQNLGNLFGSYDEMISGIISSVEDISTSSRAISETERSTFDAKIKNPFANDDTGIESLLGKSRGLF